MKQKTYFQVTGALFGLIAVLHLLRLFTNFEVNVAGWAIPIMASIVGAIVAGYLSYTAFKLGK